MVVALFATCLSASGQGNVYYVDSKVKLKELNPLIGRGLSFSRVVQLYDPSDPNAYGFYIATNSIAGVDDVNVIRSAHTDTYSWIRIDQVPLATDTVQGKLRLFSPAADPSDPVGYDKTDTDALIDALPTKSTELSDYDFSALQTNRTQVTPLMVLSGGEQIHQPAQLWVSTIAEMQAIDPAEFPNTAVFVTDTDRGGMFSRVATSGVTTNTGTMFVSSADGDYSWQRQYAGEVNAKWFGATGDGVTDDTAALQAALAYADSRHQTLYIPGTTAGYRIVPANGRTNYYDSVSGIIYRLVPSGYIAHGFDYIVQGSSGTINYRGTNYSIGTTITGQHAHPGYSRMKQVSAVTINSGGTGYSVSDVLTLDLSGGTGTAATLTVDSVSSGVITAVSLTTVGEYTTPSTTETAVAVTGGTGSGATFDITQVKSTTHDAALVPVLDVGLWSTNYYVSIRGDGVSSTKLNVEGPGAAIGILGTFPGTDPGDPTHASIKDIGIIGDRSSEGQMGLYMSYCTFFGTVSAYIEGTRIGAHIYNCWNMHIERIMFEGAGYMDWGLQAPNANQWKIDHIYTHNFRFCLEVDTSSAHGATVGDEVVVRETKNYEYEGTVTEVIDSDSFIMVLSQVDTSPDTSTNTITVDPDGAATTSTLAGGRIVGGIGMIADNLEGFWAEGSWQNAGEAGVKILARDSAGNHGPVYVFGNIEGPANGFVVERAPFETTAYVKNVIIEGSVFAGGFNGKGEFGRRNAISFDYVRGGEIKNGYYVAKSSVGASTNYCVYVSGNCYDIDIGRNTYENNVAANRVKDLQNWPKVTPSSIVMFQDFDGYVLHSATIAANSSVISVTPRTYARTAFQNQDEGGSRPLTHVIVKAKMTVNTVGSAGTRIAAILSGSNINNPQRQTPIFVTAGNAFVGSYHEATTIFPVSPDGTINIQWFAASGWNVDVELMQVGAVY